MWYTLHRNHAENATTNGFTMLEKSSVGDPNLSKNGINPVKIRYCSEGTDEIARGRAFWSRLAR
jgi:hypothetical protein